MNRGEHRLQIAARLLTLPAENGADALARIKAIPKPEADHLRGLVDWVEEYEAFEPPAKDRS